MPDVIDFIVSALCFFRRNLSRLEDIEFRAKAAQLLGKSWKLNGT